VTWATALWAMPTRSRERSRRRQPLGRLTEPQDAAHAALYLASDEAAYMTGAELVLDGGFTAQ